MIYCLILVNIISNLMYFMLNLFVMVQRKMNSLILVQMFLMFFVWQFCGRVFLKIFFGRGCLVVSVCFISLYFVFWFLYWKQKVMNMIKKGNLNISMIIINFVSMFLLMVFLFMLNGNLLLKLKLLFWQLVLIVLLFIMLVYLVMMVELEEFLLFWVMVGFCVIVSEQKVMVIIKVIMICFILLLFFNCFCLFVCQMQFMLQKVVKR